MDHDYIEAHDVSSRYVTGRLPDGEEREFEAHLVDCQRCIDAVEAEMSLREGLRIVGSESAPQPAARVVTLTSRATTAYRFLQAAAAILLVVSVGLGAWLSRTRVELSVARGARAELERRAEQAEQSARTLEKRLAEVTAPANAAPTIARTEPVVPAAVFALTTVRGSSSAGANPVNRIRIDGNPKVVVFSLEIPSVPGAGDYEVSLKDQAGRLLWSGTLTSSPSDTVSVAVDPALLPAGDYVLELSRRSASGSSTLIGRYVFRVELR
jgi:anti-sigma factor RsiW